MSESSLGPLLERLQCLFVDCYNKQSLRELLLFKMNRDLGIEVSDEDDFRTVVFNLLDKARREGWLLDLARHARDDASLKPEWVGAVEDLELTIGRGAAKVVERATTVKNDHPAGIPAPSVRGDHGVSDPLQGLEVALSALAPTALARLVSLGLGERPDDIAAAAREPLSGPVLIRWAQERGRIADLLAAVSAWGR
jgi:Effector-associated domain 1